MTVELLENRVLLSGGYGGYGESGPSVDSIQFGVVDYGYGSAVGELTGGISNGSGLEGEYSLEIDYWNDGSIDYTDAMPNDVGGIWAELNLPYTDTQPNGTMPIAVRVKESVFDTGVVRQGDWFVDDVAVMPPANNAPTIDEAEYTPWDVGYGLLGYLSGNIVDDTPEFGTYQLQFDDDGNGSVDFTMLNADLSDNGTAFLREYSPEPASQTIKIRVRETDVITGQILEGAWTNLTVNPSLPPNDPPEIDYLVFNDSGYGGYGGYGGTSYGSVEAEFEDYTDGNTPTYYVEMDSNGDGEPDPSTGFPLLIGNSHGFQTGGVPDNARIRIKEQDIFGRELYSPWVAMADIGTPNHDPTAPAGPNERIVSALTVTPGQVLGTWPADDPDGDALEYSASVPGLNREFHVVGGKATPPISIDKNSGAVTVTNKEQFEKILKSAHKYEITVTATDGKGSISYGVTIYDRYQDYMSKAAGWISSWGPYAKELSSDTRDVALAAVDRVDAFGSIEYLSGYTTTVTSLTWAAAAYAAPPFAGHLSVAAVAATLLIDALIAKADEGHDAIIAYLEDSAEQVYLDDATSVTARQLAEFDAQTIELAIIEEVDQNGNFVKTPDEQAALAASYYNSVKLSLPIEDPPPIPEEDDVYGAMLLKYAGARGWSGNLVGSDWHIREHLGGYWYTKQATNWIGITDVTDLAQELNAIYYRWPKAYIPAGN